MLSNPELKNSNYWFVAEGRKARITNMFDIDCNETSDPRLAHTIVGELPDGQWLASECRLGDIMTLAA